MKRTFLSHRMNVYTGEALLLSWRKMYRIIDINSDLKLIHFIAYLFFFLLRFRFFSSHFWGHNIEVFNLIANALPVYTHFGPNDSHTPQIFYANFLIYINIMYWMPIGSFSPEWKSMQILIRNWCYRAWRKLCRIWIYLNVWMCRRILWIELTKYRQFIQWL